MKIGIICVYNDKNAFEKMLNTSLERQNIRYELIALDNSNHRFKSAAEALNYGVSLTDSEILIFSHQDIFLKTDDALRKFSYAISSLPEGSILGTQGVKDRSKEYFSNITYGTKFVSELNYSYDDKCIIVSSVDEGFFGMKRETWNRHNFDEKLCDDWHLYCVESCLWNRKNGGLVYVCPIQLHHFSMGTITLGYMNNLRRLCMEYRRDFKYIWTTCYKVRTARLYIDLLWFAWVFNRLIRGNLR